MAERLQKLLAQWGLASRRQAEDWIRAGRVRVNGVPAELGQRADPDRDRVEVDGRPLQPQAQPDRLYLLLHKPARVLSACRDDRGRPTVLDLLPPALRDRQGLHPVGRLDWDSTGALLLTNDGDLTFHLAHPRHRVPKTYRVWVAGIPSAETLARWRQGVELDGRPTRPARVRLLRTGTQRRGSAPSACLEIVLTEGRNRQIRRTAEQLGHPVRRLHRTAIGPVTLHHPDGSPLQPGQHRPLQATELAALHPTGDRRPATPPRLRGRPHPTTSGSDGPV